ncbi:MAG: YybH family protein [Pyrinomonadaceae bacterium]
MKRTIFLIPVIFIFTFSAFGQKAAGAKIDPSKAVHDAFDRLIDGIKQVDVDKVMGAYEKTDRLLIFNNNGSATIGWDNVKNNVETAYAKITNVTIEITGLRIEMLGAKSAYVSCKWKQTQENDHKLEDASGRMTLIFKLVGKDWKITHRHTSPDNPGANRPVFPSERNNN